MNFWYLFEILLLEMKIKVIRNPYSGVTSIQHICYCHKVNNIEHIF